MTPADAKARLLEVGQKESVSAALLGTPIVRIGALVIAGALVARALGRRGKPRAGSSFLHFATRAGLAAAPMLIQEFLRNMPRADNAHSAGSAPSSPNQPGRP